MCLVPPWMIVCLELVLPPAWARFSSQISRFDVEKRRKKAQEYVPTCGEDLFVNPRLSVANN